VRARRLPEGKQVRLEVADTGRGIPRAYRGRLFEPYFSTKKMGTGLGLAIVHRIVTDHGGHIQLRDNKPHGTIVLIDLPVRTTEITAAE
jgi:two-component system nitrogen regulation sensor histidine kinase NtrY